MKSQDGVLALESGRLLTAADVAARWQCDHKTVRRTRGLRAVTIGQGRKRPRVRYRLEDVEAYEQSRAGGKR
jgi:hypothetical protein